MTHTTPSRYARYVGRVGALAFALGVGVAVAKGTAVAAADTSGSANATAHSARQDARTSTARPAGSRTPTKRSTTQLSALPAASVTPVRPAAPTGSATLTDVLGYARRETNGVDRRSVAPSGPVAEATAPAPTTVLATSDQLTGEQIATQIAGSPIMQLAKAVLKVGWLLAARNNFAGVGGPDAENMAQLDQAVAEYANQAAIEVQLLNSNNPKILQQVNPPHNWFGQSFSGARIWYDNPDTIYRFVGVNTTSSYVITGRFGGPLPADTNFSVLTGLSGTTADNLNGKGLVLNPDGSFTITADSIPTAPGQTNHLYLAPGTTLITTRNTLADWTAEDPMSLSILRVSGPPDSLFSQFGGFAIPGIGQLVSANPLLTQLVSIIPPLPAPRLLQSIEAAAIMLLLGITGENQYMSVATTDAATGQPKGPNVFTDPTHQASFLATQVQSTGYFQLADDEALVLTIDPGKARYFSVPVTNDWTVTDNYWDQLTSRNVSQSVANPDGTYTIAVSPTDPGVANWVSTGGLNQGTIAIRFQDFDPNSTVDPTVSSQVVKLNALSGSPTASSQVAELDARSGLPTVTPQERQAQLDERKLGYNKRYAPYPQA